ncbi:MAG: chemotaxis response regulator protein-glutamate methylesterase [Phycisphaerae bacterium]|nr:chemotaxis response regulator protein-glutamate methylesterase [Gemmatimonadaceae bacterium]
MRQVLAAMFDQDASIEVVGVAGDPYIAWEKIQRLDPDVITLDIEMPRMDGLTFLAKLMQRRPSRVVMISSLTERGCAATLRALELGAVDFVAKPAVDVASGIADMATEIVLKVRAAADARLRGASGTMVAGVARDQPAEVVHAASSLRATHRVIAIGASTGGTEALREVLSELPADSPGVVVVQHMPEKFTRSFAERLNGLCRIGVSEARDGDRILPGHALIAPGGLQMAVTRSGAAYGVRVYAGAPVNRHRPSVDVLFNSVAACIGSNAVGAILTGMGDDGARGLLAMRESGARTVAQDEASCIVYGMPREAVLLGGVDEVLPLERIAGAVLRMASAR